MKTYIKDVYKKIVEQSKKKFFYDVFSVGAHRIFADRKKIGNFFRAVSQPNKIEYLSFARR